MKRGAMAPSRPQAGGAPVIVGEVWQALSLLPPRRRARWCLRAMFAGLCALVAWAAVGKIDQVTRAPAQIIAAARTQVIQSPDGGIVTQLHVHEGDTVRAGDVLVTLQEARARAAVADSNAKVAALRITLARLHAEVYGKPLAFPDDLSGYDDYIRNQRDLYQKRRTAIEEDLAALGNMLALSRQELAINRKLVATGDVSQAEILRLQRAVADIEAQMTSRRNKYFQDAQAEMTKAQEDLTTQTEQLRDRSQVLEQTRLTATADGIVNNIRVNTIGGVVRPGETVMEILPTSGDLLAEARVSPADIAFVKVGQRANVRIDAYDASIFGAMQGEVSYISPDVLQEETRQGPAHYYRVRILIREAEFKHHSAEQILLRPGMTASVDIKARERTVLQCLAKPITKGLQQSLGER
ncbi:HlyD family efflux transporter periplasmic adaptor subunit [Achromobacter ruhlandii]|uniref:HlyD family efflux transporter periplasmic adaptor subunit n=1 Tax=Achromobacter ruhlandii TaxID=72557 RepID=UPI001EEE5BD3|nr:HlyD family efflux transporter periplasmic adaptor subunit [Achromobacter ruhlandii]